MDGVVDTSAQSPLLNQQNNILETEPKEGYFDDSFTMSFLCRNCGATKYMTFQY